MFTDGRNQVPGVWKPGTHYEIDKAVSFEDGIIRRLNAKGKEHYDLEILEYGVEGGNCIYIGESANFYIEATGGEDIQYKFTVFKDGEEVYSTGYIKDNKISWKPEKRWRIYGSLLC